ncbi:MAG TPA: hypothetical protein VK811_03975 [Candidatus Acidoferrum sp.]|jgi:hypothetical protein|nr:hypothetical protein [Candidatus Acidoferrum sp.]
MKLRFSVMVVITTIVTGLCLLTGCASMKYGEAHKIRLKIVDGKTGDPVSGVSVMWREDREDLIYGNAHLGPTDLTPSDNNGEITINAAHEKLDGRFILICPGYVTLYGVYSGGSLSVSREIQPPPFPQDIFELDDPQTDDELNDGSYVVRMPK